VSLATALRHDDAAHPRVFLHGDLHPRNIFIDGDAITVIDFDHAAVGDPAWDAGYLLGQMQLTACERWRDIDRLKHIGARFLSEFTSGPDMPDAGAFARRATRYRALTLLESLHYRCCVLHAAGPDLSEILLGECERAVAEWRTSPA
jgi:aminoglycoside phosphotransferase (APT) family kinase protein